MLLKAYHVLADQELLSTLIPSL